MKLEDITRMALVVQQGMPGSPRSPGSRGGRRRQHQELARRLRAAAGATNAREAATELAAITSVEELEIDYDQALSIKRGDLAIIQGETFRANPRAPHLADIPLILKKLDCVDRRTFDQKWYEIDTFARFRGHPNIVTLYSFWKEKPKDNFTYKTIVMMLEEGVMGDMLSTVVRAATRPTERLALKWTCDISKALVAIHNCQIIHTRIKPSAIYLDQNRTAMIGEFGKLEVDVARRTHKLFSKILIGQAIPHTLVYWAPELLRLESYGLPADIWAFGVTLFQLVTGELPFDIENEENFRDDVMTASINWEPLQRLGGMEVVATIIENCLRVDPDERWTANQILAFAQQSFAVEVQRIWKGHVERERYRQALDGVVKIQAAIRGWLAFTKFRRTRQQRRQQAATAIQSSYRSYTSRSEYQRVREALLKCQANVMARQSRRKFLDFKNSVCIIQRVVRRFLCVRWARRVKSARLILENKLQALSSMVIKYREDADEFSALFADRQLPASLKHLSSLETYELHLPEELIGLSGSALPMLRSTEQRVKAVQGELDSARKELAAVEEHRREKERKKGVLREDLGEKFEEYEPMKRSLLEKLKRVNEKCQRSRILLSSIQHVYSYSKWDQVHEPNNVVENVCRDNEEVYRAVSPEIDLTLEDGELCFLSAVEFESGEPAPMTVKVYTSNKIGEWNYVAAFQCDRDQAKQTFQLPGEQICTYLRLQFPNNVRGGSIVSIRRVRAIGLPNQHVEDAAVAASSAE